MIVSNGEGKVNDRESGVSAHNRLIRRVVGLVEENGVRTRFRLVRARGHYLHRSEDQVELARSTRDHLEERPSEAATLYLKVDFTGCIPSGCAPRLYQVNFHPIIARLLRR